MPIPRTTEAAATQTQPTPFEWPETPALDLQPTAAVEVGANTPIPLALVRLLATDAKLRSELGANPRETLAMHGIHVDPSAIPAEVKLPSQQKLDHLIVSYAADEDRAAILRHFGFLGGISD